MCAAEAVDRLRIGSRRAETSRQVGLRTGKAVDRFASSSRQVQFSAEIPADRIMTPHEVWYGRKPEVANLRVFGSVCYLHVDQSLFYLNFHMIFDAFN